MRIIFFALISAFIISSCTNTAQTNKKNEIVIKGKVKFPDNRFKMMIYKYEGFEKISVDSVELNKDSTYVFKMKVKEAGVYTLNCQKWQSVNFWAEDEDLTINFRGQDTAKIKIKNPPYVHIYGGLNNEVMNLIAFNNYRNYQNMIAAGKEIYEASKSNCKEWKDFAMKGYNKVFDDLKEREKYIAKYYADRNSILSLLPVLRDKELVNNVIATLKKKNPNYPPLLAYEKEIAEKKALKERLNIGKPAPLFSYPNKEGDKTYGPDSFKGKYLLIDFWASWCGPCRKEIPNLRKEYDKYHKQGLEILSVSIDSKKDKWLKAIDEEKMPWTQILAPESGKDIMKTYQFSGIPYIILLDKEGKILAKNLRGKKLSDKLTEIFK